MLIFNSLARELGDVDEEDEIDVEDEDEDDVEDDEDEELDNSEEIRADTELANELP